MITSTTLNFLCDLELNNNREWFHENKVRYNEAKSEFYSFIDALIARIGEYDPSILHHSAKSTCFRINRDIRFSKNKAPYKTNFGAHITSAEKRSEIHSRAGYYIHLEPGKSMLAGGAYMPESKWLKSIRASIDSDPEELKKIIGNKSFKKCFGELEGEKLKTAPKGYPKDHPEIDLLRYKSFLATRPVTDEEALSVNFLESATETFSILKPLDDFLNRAING